VLAASVAVTVGSAAADGRVFYLGVHAPQCLIAPTDPSAKLFTAVPCANSAHNLEVYAVVRGGWGKAATLQSEGLIARSRCLARYRGLVGHGAPSTAGWEFLFADPGAEAARYGDRIVCAFRTWPRLAPLGSGWHVH
jgi:hypothetical protein